MKWASVLSFLAALCAIAAAQPATLPQRNLLVELRTTSDSTDARTGAGLRGGPVVIGSGGTASGSVEIGAQARTRDTSGSASQQVMVLNGGQALLRLARSTPLQFFQVLWTAQGPTLTPTTLWTESVQGFTARPRWPGGNEPVTVEVSAQSAPSAGDVRVLTTVQLPLGQWVTIAALAGGTRERELGGLSTQEVERRFDELVQMRVSAP